MGHTTFYHQVYDSALHLLAGATSAYPNTSEHVAVALALWRYKPKNQWGFLGPRRINMLRQTRGGREREKEREREREVPAAADRNRKSWGTTKPLTLLISTWKTSSCASPRASTTLHFEGKRGLKPRLQMLPLSWISQQQFEQRKRREKSIYKEELVADVAIHCVSYGASYVGT